MRFKGKSKERTTYMDQGYWSEGTNVGKTDLFHSGGGSQWNLLWELTCVNKDSIELLSSTELQNSSKRIRRCGRLCYKIMHSFPLKYKISLKQLLFKLGEPSRRTLHQLPWPMDPLNQPHSRLIQLLFSSFQVIKTQPCTVGVESQFWSQNCIWILNSIIW